MAIKWFSRSEKVACATISKTNIVINKTGSSKCENAYACFIGYDKDNKMIYIKPISKEEYDLKTSSQDEMFKLSVHSSYTRISSAAFINMVSSLCEKTFDNNKYKCYFDSEYQSLVIDLNKEIK
ncbi:MAG: hypothetical protein IAC78_00365 [Firmicutes bacterium]|uniref:Uncharacterized protein n=1 Tax=Candidatus Scatoplasma merdavium TaxID=2840932 RepID=A0A9D9D6X4_9BACL|nr:hypothetical protein [Candidatus Scatoplasma merdavium]